MLLGSDKLMLLGVLNIWMQGNCF